MGSNVQPYIFFFVYMSDEDIGYAEQSIFAFCKYNAGGLMKRVMVGRMDIWGTGIPYGSVFKKRVG